jgi:hypothetical protein
LNDVAIVAGQGTMDLDDLGPPVDQESSYAVGIIVQPMDDAAVPGQIRQFLRYAVLFQVCRRGAQEAPVRHDPTRVDAVVGFGTSRGAAGFALAE